MDRRRLDRSRRFRAYAVPRHRGGSRARRGYRAAVSGARSDPPWLLVLAGIVAVLLLTVGVGAVVLHRADATSLVRPTLAAPLRSTGPQTMKATAVPAIAIPATPASVATSSPVPTAPSRPLLPGPDVPTLQSYMLDLINSDRTGEGLAPVEWDDFAAAVAQAHAEDMAMHGYMSHWNLDGEGPDIRYGRAGGTESVQENVYMYWFRYGDGRPAPIEDWSAIVREAQKALMDSPGHRANIMASAHTHVGLGIAYNEDTGDVRIAQEFLNRYVKLSLAPAQVEVGGTLRISGQLLPGATDPFINLAYEPFPAPMTVAQVEARSTYQSPAVFLSAVNPDLAGDGTFTADVTLDHEDRPGIYHMRLWVDVGGESIFASDVAMDAVP